MTTFVPKVDRETGERLLDAFAQELLDEARLILRDGDDATKLERAAALISKTPSAAAALAMLALIASVDELGARIDAIEARAATPRDEPSMSEPSDPRTPRRPSN